MNLDAYLPSVFWILLVSWCLGRHMVALRRYTAMWHIVRRAESAGDVEVGSTLVAENQRYRYVARSSMAVVGLIIGFVGMYAVAHPTFQHNIVYGWCVLSYFYMTEVLTGWLTVRDLRVLDRIGTLDAWHQERLGLHKRIDALEATIASLQKQLAS